MKGNLRKSKLPFRCFSQQQRDRVTQVLLCFHSPMPFWVLHLKSMGSDSYENQARKAGSVSLSFSCRHGAISASALLDAGTWRLENPAAPRGWSRFSGAKRLRACRPQRTPPVFRDLRISCSLCCNAQQKQRERERRQERASGNEVTK